MVLGSLLFAGTAAHGIVAKDYPFITVASTTSLEQSGLLGYLLPVFTRARGIDVLVAAVGTGQALAIVSAANATLCSCMTKRGNCNSCRTASAALDAWSCTMT